MSLNDLLQRMDGDEAFARKFDGLEQDAWLDLAKREGYEVTAQELEANLAQNQGGELSDNDLLEVAAGRDFYGTQAKKRKLVYRPGQDKGRATALPYSGGPAIVSRLPFVTMTSETDDGDGPVMI